jgi:magnesium-protoporphyrin IX monomethyl ester (oxidative) cyclase
LTATSSIATPSANARAERPARPVGGRPVLIVVPPFQGLKCPVLGPSQLKANLVAAGFKAEVLYLNLLFAERITPQLSEWLSGTGPYLVGEYLFSHVAHGFGEDELARYADEVLAPSEIGPALQERFPGRTLLEALRFLVGEARAFIDGEAVEAIAARDPWLVGFSSTFQANCCSLAAIRELKRRTPDVLSVIGGANCETQMGEEIMKLYPEVDFIGRGECDKTFVEFVRNLAEGGDGSGVAGFLARSGPPSPPSSPLKGKDLDAQPHPDFEDYFAMLSRVSYRERITPGLAMETSRGCWWGFVQHCTFCAFNREGMVFRSKRPERVFSEMHDLVRRYGLERMEVTDNILDLQYFRSLLPELAQAPPAEFFWETKANLTRDQVRMLAKARVTWIQPGIESLSDLTLKLMKKGSRGIQNIQLLKWALESGIRVSWNWLFGFPGENEAEIDRLAETVKAIHHLQPPNAASVLYLERFSPYHMEPEEWGLTGIRAAKAYSYVYPHPQPSVDNLAFFFDCDFFSRKEGGEAYAKLQKIVARWKWAHQSSHLVAIPRRKALWIVDTRECRTRRLHKLSGLRREVYEHLFKARGLRKVVQHFQGRATPDEVTSILRELVADRLVLESDERYLGIATDPRLAYRAYPEIFPGGQITPPPPPTFAQRFRGAGSVAAFARSEALRVFLAWARRQPSAGEIGGADVATADERVPAGGEPVRAA